MMEIMSALLKVLRKMSLGKCYTSINTKHTLVLFYPSPWGSAFLSKVSSGCFLFTFHCSLMRIEEKYMHCFITSYCSLSKSKYMPLYCVQPGFHRFHGYFTVLLSNQDYHTQVIASPCPKFLQPRSHISTAWKPSSWV